LLLLGADFAWRQFYPEHAKIVQIDLEPDHLGRRHPITLGLIGDINETMKALLPRLEGHTDTEFRDLYVKRHKDLIAAQKKKAEPKHSGHISGIHLAVLIDQLAAQDAQFTSDDGTTAVWLHRYVSMNGKRRAFASLLHGTMAAAMPTALGIQKALPGRQVISMSGDGGIAMLIGDLMTAVQEKLPIKVVVFDNGKLGFIDIEQKSEGMVPLFTNLLNPDFGKVAEAMGLWGRSVDHAKDLEEAIKDWLSQPGPALLNVKVESETLVMPPAVAVGPALGMALYSARAVLHGQGGDLVEMIEENFL
jgi:pyruvate dehydrogenase (quinone)